MIVQFSVHMQTELNIFYFIVALLGTFANRVDPDETAPVGAVSSGSILFA